MASTGPHSFAPVLAALSAMQSNVERSQKSQAHDYLEKFQKSVRNLLLISNSMKDVLIAYCQKPEAWSVTTSILSASDATADVKLFAATTLKGKVGDSPQ